MLSILYPFHCLTQVHSENDCTSFEDAIGNISHEAGLDKSHF